MKRSPLAGPEPFSLSPLLALLPHGGEVSRLHHLSASFFARLEKVNRLRSDAVGGEDREAQRRLGAEEGMLRTILDWLAQGAPPQTRPAAESREEE